MNQFGLNLHNKEKFNHDFIKIQRILENSSYERFDLSNGQISLQKLENNLQWENWIKIEEESRIFLEKQILDLNTTTQTTSRNNESISAKKKDSELMINSFQKSVISNNAKLNNTVLGVKVKNISEVKMQKILMTNSQQISKKDFLKKLMHSQRANHNSNQNLKNSYQLNSSINKNNNNNFYQKEILLETFQSKQSKRKRLSEIPNNTVISENEEIPEEQEESYELCQNNKSNFEILEENEHQWNGMTNSISDLRETTLINDSMKSRLNVQLISEEPDSAFKENQKSIFLKEDEEELSINSNLQTPEFREASHKQEFYPQSNLTSNRVLYDYITVKNSENDTFKKNNNRKSSNNSNNHNQNLPHNDNNFRSNDVEDAAFSISQNLPH